MLKLLLTNYIHMYLIGYVLRLLTQYKFALNTVPVFVSEMKYFIPCS